MQLSIYDPVSHFPFGVWRKNPQEKRPSPFGEHCSDDVVCGKDRFKFFQRPVEPRQFPTSERLTTDRYDNLYQFSDFINFNEEENLELCTRGTQTDYRESEAQTDPWNPPYYVQGEYTPELLTIAHFTYGSGLPAGESEIELIEHNRAKREWEASLPPLSSDRRIWKKRQAMIAEKEKEEWDFKGKKVEKLQNEQLKFLDISVAQARQQQEQENIEHLEWLWARKKAQTDKQLKKIKSKYSRDIRKIGGEYLKKPGSAGRRQELISSAGDSLLTRYGQDSVKKVKMPRSKYLTTTTGLNELEGWLQETANFAMTPEIYLPKQPPRPSRYQKLLQQTHKDILESKSSDMQDVPLTRHFKLERPKIRPPTPSVPPVSDVALDRDRAAIILQRVLRGRARQKEMFDGRARKKDLIDELHSTHPIYKAEEPDKEKQKETTLALYEEKELFKEKESAVDEVLAEMEGAAVSSVLNFLSKEMLRLVEERKVRGLMHFAEQERRLREAEEAGTRQKEEQRQRMENEVFNQVQVVRHPTVEGFVSEVMSEFVDDDVTSPRYLALESERRRISLESEEIVSELMYGYLLPEVERQSLRERNNLQQQKYRAAARELIYASTSMERQALEADTPDVNIGATTSQNDIPVAESSETSAEDNIIDKNEDQDAAQDLKVIHSDTESNIIESKVADDATADENENQDSSQIVDSEKSEEHSQSNVEHETSDTS